MKQFIFSAIFTACFFCASANVKQTADPVIKDTTINKTTYKIYQGSRGGKYIVVISKNGKPYKKYFKQA